MAEDARPALGLSIGATNLAAVTADHAITRKPVLTLYRQRPAEVGMPSENPRLDEPGLVITDFVDRVGDPIGIVAADGSVHHSEALVVDGLRALASAVGGRTLSESVAVTYPAHWGAPAVAALGAAVSRVARTVEPGPAAGADPGCRGDPVRGAGQPGHTGPRRRCGVRFRWQRHQHHPGRCRSRVPAAGPYVSAS